MSPWIVDDLPNVIDQVLFSPNDPIVEVLLPAHAGPVPLEPISRTLLEENHGAPEARQRRGALENDVKVIGHETVDNNSAGMAASRPTEFRGENFDDAMIRKQCLSAQGTCREGHDRLTGVEVLWEPMMALPDGVPCRFGHLS